ncbi:MAG: nucleotidyltransferase domain-containing protein [Anaerolineae bacterium]|nr:nucleotidyltransferase domain-containing protein [Anaerolineae bacterium]
MSANQYLRDVLASQTFQDDDPELKALRDKRDEVEKILRKAFPGVAIRYAGSHAKGTMICASYDLDLTCYFDHDDTQAGDSLEEIYNTVKAELEKHYSVNPKTSALRLEEGEQDKQYTHVDVVPGRFIDGDDGDVFLYQNRNEKNRLKTNLDVHIETIRDSGLTDAIRLVKYWRERQGFKLKTFVLELLVVNVLASHKSKGLEEQLTLFWECLRDSFDSIAIEDPANPDGNDLMPVLTDAKVRLQTAAEATLQTIEYSGWEQVFGNVDDQPSEPEKAAALISFPQVRTGGAKPWSN